MSRKYIIALAVAAALAHANVWAAVSADEAKQLGTTLTAVGAEKAANKDGTIPAYTGGLTTPPASFQKGSGFRTDPYADEKPRLTITAKDIAAQGDKLTEGTKELLKRDAAMRLDVYPTHRTVALPQRVLDNTMKNATGAKTIEGGDALENVMPGYPFRSRRRAPKRSGTTCCATAAWATTARATRTGTWTPPAWPPSPCRPTRSGRGRSTTRSARARSPRPSPSGTTS